MKRNIVIATVAAAALIGGGTVAAYASGDDDSAPKERQSSAQSADVTAVDAVAAALGHTPGTAVAVDREDDGEDAWDVDVVKSNGTEYTVKVSPDTGKVLGAQRDDDDDDARDDLAALKGTDVDAREAARTAAAQGTVTEVDLDDDGPAAWNVQTTKGEWKVDVKTGKLTQDHDDDRNGQDDRDDRDDRHGDDD
ncbi:PepSY domain-containing protein [Streptomyces sp. P17]|uniref:PepSY domain-containing protein n=1 Tax=Streptomyces sp. P17 TaxID=3074716 RepID=UPI0028F41992|nr:PepSY domain-containing protein [Streptomyces sp. P17]MDT9697332.1 PepSY domain-containing protein [Streptomyces sp. P17]